MFSNGTTTSKIFLLALILGFGMTLTSDTVSARTLACDAAASPLVGFEVLVRNEPIEVDPEGLKNEPIEVDPEGFPIGWA